MVTPVDGPITDLYGNAAMRPPMSSRRHRTPCAAMSFVALADLDREVRARMMMWFTAAGFFAAVAAAVYAALTYYR